MMRLVQYKMRPKLFFLFFLFILISSTYGLQAGSKETLYVINDCEKVTINVAGSQKIVEGEYIIENCVNTFNNTWDCNCSNGFYINVTTLVNTYNTYEFDIKYSYLYEEEEVVVFSSSGGGSSVNTRRYENDTFINETEEEETEDEDTDEVTNTGETANQQLNPDVVEVPEPGSEQEQNNNLITGQVINTETNQRSPYGLAAIFLLLVGAGIMFVLRRRKF